MKNEEKSMMSFLKLFTIIIIIYKKIANINREVEDFDHVQVNRYEQTDDILLGLSLTQGEIF
jgi:hypothetical protein